jgi:transcriptional regulator with XRE-family HTH domain
MDMLGRFIQEQRKKRGLTQEFLALRLGISRPTYMQIERGERELVVSEAKKLAGIFDMLLDDFLASKEISPPRIKLEKPTKIMKAKDNGREIRISVPQEKIKKFKEALLYILERIGARPNIGEAVVCKLMYFIDFDFYEKFEEQLIGAKYIKNHHGPTPIAFPKIVAQMEKTGDLTRVVQKYFQYDQKKYLPLRKSDLSEFSAREKEFIDEEIERFKDFNAAQIEKYSHKDVPWITADNLQIIDYEAVFYRTPEFSVRHYYEN